MKQDSSKLAFYKLGDQVDESDTEYDDKTTILPRQMAVNRVNNEVSQNEVARVTVLYNALVTREQQRIAAERQRDDAARAITDNANNATIALDSGIAANAAFNVAQMVNPQGKHTHIHAHIHT